MEKKSPIPGDTLECLQIYFESKEFEDDLSALFEEVQQAEYFANPARAKQHAEMQQPQYELGSVVQFFLNAIEDTDECKEVITKITKEQIENSIKRELADIRKSVDMKNRLETELNKKEIVEVFRRLIKNEYNQINYEYNGKPIPHPTAEEPSAAASLAPNPVQNSSDFVDVGKEISKEPELKPAINESQQNEKSPVLIEEIKSTSEVDSPVILQIPPKPQPAENKNSNIPQVIVTTEENLNKIAAPVASEEKKQIENKPEEHPTQEEKQKLNEEIKTQEKSIAKIEIKNEQEIKKEPEIKSEPEIKKEPEIVKETEIKKDLEIAKEPEKPLEENKNVEIKKEEPLSNP